MKLNKTQKVYLDAYNAQAGVNKVNITVDDENEWHIDGDRKRVNKFIKAMKKARTAEFEAFKDKVIERREACKALAELGINPLAMGLAPLSMAPVLTVAYPCKNKKLQDSFQLLKSATPEHLAELGSTIGSILGLTQYAEVLDLEMEHHQLAAAYIEAKELYGQPVISPDNF